MGYDYSEAPPARDFDLIPDQTVATVQMKIRPGGAGDGGLLKRSAKGDCEMLDVELTVVDGQYARRKLWDRMILDGTTSGHAKAIEVSRSRLRSIIESARGIKPDDMTPAARAARTVELSAFDGVRFITKIGIEKGGLKKDGSGDSYPDKNCIAAIITPDKKDWRAIEQSPPAPNGGGGGATPTPGSASTPAVPAITKPAWAQ